ncbi:MAG: class I SAM-dependent methyltransferase [Thermoplasmata archaeon]|nr:class I SAM-dependent methyltransferase [Thermoplasmata archaeon]
MGDSPAGPTSNAGLRAFWTAAGVPSERWPYFEFQARRYRSIIDALASVRPLDGKVVLDLGGGVGGLAVTARAHLGGTFELAEFLAPDAAHARALADRGVRRSYQVDLSALRPLDGLPIDFDGVLFVEVLEHLLVNPLFLFRNIWDHVKPGGFLFLTTPNMARIGNRWRLLRGRSIKEKGRYPVTPGGVNGHVIEYTRDELDRLLEFEGFRPRFHRIVQQIPSTTPSRRQRWGVRLLNRDSFQKWELGDDILALYEKVDRIPKKPDDPSGWV